MIHMMRKMNFGLARVAVLAVAMFTVLAIASPTAAATGTFCSAAIPPTSQTPLGNYSSLSGILGISLLIMLVMALIVAAVYMIGYSARINKLVNFSKQEIGEIFVTVLVVLIFVGSFAATASFAPPTIISGTGAYNSQIFVDDCNLLTSPAIQLFTYYIDIAVSQDVQSLIGSLTINIMPYDFGVSFSPFAGLGTANAPVGLLLTGIGGLAGLLVAVSVVLGVFYSIMPLFLFAGIILRTLPWTRAAGGAFLGMFIAFYMVFPILLHFMLVAAPSTTSNGVPQLPLSGVSSSLLGNASNFGAIFALVSSFVTVFDPVQLVLFLIGLFAENFYAVFCIVFSFIIAFDFMEMAGDFLGAPSLSSGKSLKGLL